MAYTTKAAVQSEFKSITFDTTTAVTAATVNEFIVQEEALLDAEIGTVYVVPVTGSGALSIMKNLATLRVKARIMDNLPVKTGKGEVDQGTGGEGIREKVQAIIDKIKEKKLILPGASLLESSGGVKSYTATQSKTHTFQRDIDQW